MRIAWMQRAAKKTMTEWQICLHRCRTRARERWEEANFLHDNNNRCIWAHGQTHISRPYYSHRTSRPSRTLTHIANSTKFYSLRITFYMRWQYSSVITEIFFVKWLRRCRRSTHEWCSLTSHTHQMTWRRYFKEFVHIKLNAIRAWQHKIIITIRM